MQSNSDQAATSWIRPEFARLLAILWVAGLALLYLVRYDAWVLPFQLADMIGVSAPAFRCGPYFHEFWSARVFDITCVMGIVAAALGAGATVAGRLIAR